VKKIKTFTVYFKQNNKIHYKLKNYITKIPYCKQTSAFIPPQIIPETKNTQEYIRECLIGLLDELDEFIGEEVRLFTSFSEIVRFAILLRYITEARQELQESVNNYLKQHNLKLKGEKDENIKRF